MYKGGHIHFFQISYIMILTTVVFKSVAGMNVRSYRFTLPAVNVLLFYVYVHVYSALKETTQFL